MVSKEGLGQTQDNQQLSYIRSLVARAAESLVEQESLVVEPDVQRAVSQTIEVHRWLIALQNDAYDNYRGGTLERTDMPLPRPPSGPLVAYILRTLNIID